MWFRTYDIPYFTKYAGQQNYANYLLKEKIKTKNNLNFPQNINSYQNRILKVFATKSVRQTNKEKPSASWVCFIWRYCGTYGTTPPITIADAAAPPTIWETRKFNSSLIIQSSIVTGCVCLYVRTFSKCNISKIKFGMEIDRFAFFLVRLIWFY